MERDDFVMGNQYRLIDNTGLGYDKPTLNSVWKCISNYDITTGVFQSVENGEVFSFCYYRFEPYEE